MMPHYDPKMHHHVPLKSLPPWKCDATDLLKKQNKTKKPFISAECAKYHTTSPCQDHCGKQPGRQALTQTLTCLVDLIAQGEASTLPCIVRGELDIERGAGRDDGRRCYVPTVLAQQVCCFTVPISDLNVVIPVKAGEMAVKPSVREMLQDARNKHKTLLCIFLCISQNIFQTSTWDSYHSYHTTHPPMQVFPFFCLTAFKFLSLLLLTPLIYCTCIHFNCRGNMQNSGHNLPPFPQDSFCMGETQGQISWECSPSLISLLKHHQAT